MKSINTLKLLLLAGWIGSSVLLSAVVAPGAFAILASREEAGAVVGVTLRAVNISGFAIGLLLITLCLVARNVARNIARHVSRNKGWSRSAFFEIILLGVVVLATGVGEWVIAAQLRALRVTIGRPIDQLTANAPLRLQFNALHAYSVDALAIGMIAAVMAFVLMSRSADAPRRMLNNL
ncbi:MAG: DUF4149 domain-containing protein [Pyrinomonadaceae bacterium]